MRLSAWERHASALLECWLVRSGRRRGRRRPAARRGEPVGRLAETLPLRLEDTPSYLNFPGEAGTSATARASSSATAATTRCDREVSYPFGHGLSYTTFEYADLRASVSGRAEDRRPGHRRHLPVTNTGHRRGKEVVQLYVGDPEASVARPRRELKGFAKVDLAPGETETVTFRLERPRPVLLVDRARRWALEPGEFDLAVGASSRDLRLRADRRRYRARRASRSTAMSTLRSGSPTRRARPALRAAVGTDETADPQASSATTNSSG